MKPINEVYPDYVKAEGDYFYGPSDYNPLLQSLGYEILLQKDDNDYQGDSRLLLKDGERYGLLIFGWGSCSGCDALQACNSMQDIADLREGIHSQILWKDSKSEMLAFVNNRDWELQYSWHQDETKDFVNKAKEMLCD